ncbi:MAG: molybdopterin/thiamine biosynthesis adenylyltransferase/rhodanese-related sulfurtransferase [Crocinitomicaceae bacterium]|jgi:molybdopterin/thiamine biosynthesis adenylyltransferase/rhodanese-related sulfurtransferase
MLTPEEKEIYSRHLLLEEIGLEGQLMLKNSSVLVIGAGGLGCPVLQYLCAAGVGTLGIIDDDTVDKSNLQRQVLYGHSSLGKLKVVEAKRRLNDLNPYVEINTYPERITVENALIIGASYDIIVDCTDNYQTRYLVNDACYLLDKPLVYGAIHKFEGQVTVFNHQDGPTYRCVFPEPPKEMSISNCSESGVLGVLPGIVGSLQANEVIKLITNTGEVLNGKMVLYHGLENAMTSFKIKKKNVPFYQELNVRKQLLAEDYQFSCEQDLNKIDSLLSTEILSNYQQVIDVRELHEQPKISEFDVLSIPLNEIETRISEIDPTKSTLVFCQSGIRSQRAISLLETMVEIDQLDNLEGGISALQQLNRIEL